MTGLRYLKNVATLKLDQSACIGCGGCLEVCPHQVFALEGKKARIDDRDACMECGACAKNCPVSVITVDAGVGCASGMINAWLQEHNVRGMKGGSCC
ncbi:MAG: mercury methylation ferredoxin HgcB [Desulfuromonadaceae bacterium]|nr:mercury methylation ferredoxin HgcB [Desulfuromonadaceae bacterium]MDD5104412.1 mercury methylation ferredoxin HgcB [Desulfuromonadaceae bacterium]